MDIKLISPDESKGNCDYLIAAKKDLKWTKIFLILHVNN